MPSWALRLVMYISLVSKILHLVFRVLQQDSWYLSVHLPLSFSSSPSNPTPLITPQILSVQVDHLLFPASLKRYF